MASAGFIRFVVCLVDACRLQADSLIHQIKQLHKYADESYLSFSSRLNYLLRLLRLSLAHSPTSLISKALRMESHHADVVQHPAAVYSSVKAMMEGTPLSADDLQLVRIAVYYGLQVDPFQAAFIPRAPDDDTSESDIFQRLMQLEECRLPPPSSFTDDSRIIFRSQTIASVSSPPFSSSSQSWSSQEQPLRSSRSHRPQPRRTQPAFRSSAQFQSNQQDTLVQADCFIF